MSLSITQRRNTVREFRENIARLGLTNAQLAEHFGVDELRLEQIITLRSGVLENPWIIRNYLIVQAERQGVELEPFTALVGDHHDYWFLDADAIDRGQLL